MTCNNNSKTEGISLHFSSKQGFLQPMDLIRSAKSSELATIKDICTLFGTFWVGVLRVMSRFKFERNWRYLFIQIMKMAKEGRCSLHWLRGCSRRTYRSIPKNSSKKIRYLTLYLNTNSQSTSWHTQPLRNQPFSLGSRPRTCLGTKIHKISDFSCR